MDSLPPAVQRVLEGGIDHYSQQQAEWYSQIYLVLLVVVSFAVSYATSSVLVALKIFGAGFVLLMLACVPPWPFLNRHPVKWLSVRKAPEKVQ